MKEFEQIKEKWRNQTKLNAPVDGVEKIIEKTEYLKKGYRITNMVLVATVLILIIFFFYVKAYLATTASLGLGLMIGGLILRILLEYLNLKRLQTIKYDLSFKSFEQKMKAYYNTRIKTHYYITPIVVILYVLGFLILMPFFKEALSEGFYIYTQISSIVILVFGVYFIYKEIQKELYILKNLIE